MRLTYSVSGIPYIEIDEQTKIIFAKLHPQDKHYKWLAVKAVEVLNGEVGKGKRRYLFTKTTPINFMTDLKLRGWPKGLTGKHPSLTKVKHALLKRIFSRLCVQDPQDDDMILFPTSKLSDLELELDKRYNNVENEEDNEEDNE